VKILIDTNHFDKDNGLPAAIRFPTISSVNLPF